MTFGIVGLGLIGGSFALSLKQNALANQILGFDNNELHVQQALDLNIIDQASSIDEMIKLCDVLVLAIPVRSIVAVLKALKNVPEKLTIIEFGSTKNSIIAAIPKSFKAQCIPSHPMAGTEYTGPTAAFAALLPNKVMVICQSQDIALRHLQRAKTIYEKIGMKIFTMKGDDHDLHVGFISHLPHVMSFTLANVVLAREDKEHILPLAASGFRDMSRLAKSSPQMWSDIFRENKTHVLNNIKDFKLELDKFESAISRDDWQAVQRFLQDANVLNTIFR